MAYRARLRQLPAAGISLVEVLVGVSIAALVAVFLVVGIQQYVQLRSVMLSEVQRVYLAEEGYEMVRFLRDESWNNITALSAGTWYGLELLPNDIQTTTTPETIGANYERSFVVTPLYRHADGSVADPANPGSASTDSDGRMVTVRVAGPQGTTTVESIITNIFDI